MGALFALVLVECHVLTVAEHIPSEDITSRRFVDGRSVSSVAKQSASGIADEFHVLAADACGVVGALKHNDFLDAEELCENLLVYGSRVCGAAGVLHALDDVAVVLQCVEGINAEAELVGSSAASELDFLLALIEECDGIEVGVSKLEHLLFARVGSNASVLVCPYACSEEVLREEDVLVQEHLLGCEANLRTAGISYARSVCSLEVESADLVDAYDDLIDFALVGVVGLTHDGRLNLTEGRLAAHVVASEVCLAEFVVVAGALCNGADREDLRCDKVCGVGEMRHRHICQIVVRLPAFRDCALDACVSVFHCWYPPLAVTPCSQP